MTTQKNNSSKIPADSSLSNNPAPILLGNSATIPAKIIKDIPLPLSTVFVALLHKFEAVVPGAEDIILEGDRIVVITKEDSIKELLNLFT